MKKNMLLVLLKCSVVMSFLLPGMVNSAPGAIDGLGVERVYAGAFKVNNVEYTRVYLRANHNNLSCDNRSVILIKKHENVNGEIIEDPDHAEKFSLILMAFSNGNKIGAWLNGECVSFGNTSYGIASRVSVRK